MSNGPLGGFMPTPPAPSQPPQVKVDTTADSRGNFNNFLKNMNSAAMFTPPIAPLGLGSGMPSAIQPTINPMNDIDIFNQPVQMMFNGGEAEDFSDFAGFEDSSDPFGGGGQDSFEDSGNDEQIIGTPVDISQEVAALPDVFTGTDTSMFSDDPSSATPMGLAMPSGQNFGSKLPAINFNQKAIENALNQFPDANRYVKGDIESVLQDFANNNDIVGALDYFQKDSLDGDKMGLGEKVVNSIIQASNVNPSTFSAKAFSQIMPNEDKILDLGKGADEINKEIPVPFGKIGADTTISPDGTITRKITSTPSYDLDQIMDIEKAVGESGATSAITPSIFDSSNITEGALGARNRGTSQDTIETAKNAIRASAGNNMAIDNLVSQFGSLDPSIGKLAEGIKSGVGEIGEIRPGDVEDLSGTPTSLPSALGPLNIVSTQGALPAKSTVPALPAKIANVPEIDSSGIPYREDRALGTLPFRPDADAFDDGAMRGETIQQVVNRLNRPSETYEENVGRAFSPERMAEIERLYNVPVGQTQAGKGTDPTFFESQGFPTPVTFLGDFIERANRERMATDIALGRPQGFFEGLGGFTAKPAGSMQEYMKYAQPNYSFGDTSAVSKSIPEGQLVRGNTGRVIGIKDARGNLVTGTDPDKNIFQDDDGSEEIIRKKLLPVAAKEEEKEDKPPNIIGGGDPPPVPEIVPTVVASPFAPSSAKINPVNFDTGDLNKLIEMLTGVAAKPIVSAKKGGVIGMANGGLIKAVDDFLAAG